MKKIAWFLLSLMLFSAAALAADVEMKSVQSSLLDKVGYDPETKVLSVQMNNSSDIYVYKDVPQSIYEGLLAAESKGAYYVMEIKGKFETTRK
jgi:ABC-type oligopeptide transport system substrate-binding subunit